MPASPFTVTATPPTSLKLKPGEDGKFSFTVTNLAAPDNIQDVMLRALLVGPGGKREEVDWLVAEPSRIPSMSAGKTESVTIVVTPTDKIPRGKYSVQLAIGDNDRPHDTYTYSQPVDCEVVGPNEVTNEGVKQPRLPWWLIPAIVAGLLLGAGSIVVAWTARGNGGPQGVPSGTIVAFAGNTAPDGWLLCDGKLISRTQYATLYAVVGDTWGAGDGSKKMFNLPDLRGFFLRGTDDEGLRDKDLKGRISIVDGSPAAGVGSMQRHATAMPNSSFQISNSGEHHHQDPTFNAAPGPFELATQTNGLWGYDYGAQSAPTTKAGDHSHSFTGGDVETRPVNVAVNYLIKI